jgi:methionine sulfoxide reductase heme-binding subunit
MPITLRRVVILIFGCLPLALLIFGVINQSLGGDPAKAIVLDTGRWALRFLLITLAVSPLVRHLHWRWLMMHRRMLGLFALLYALLHLLAYYQFILGGQLGNFFLELAKRPYILVGMPVLVILIALGVTSTKGWMKRLGKRWQVLHRLVYIALLLAWVHLFMQVRSSYFEATLYGVLGLVLLSIRVPSWWSLWQARQVRIQRQHS